MTRNLALIVGLILIVISPQLAACGEAQYPVLDSKFPAAEAKLGWLDNEHVVFHGYEVGKFGQKSADDGHEFRETGLFIWDIPQNKVTKYSAIWRQRQRRCALGWQGSSDEKWCREIGLDTVSDPAVLFAAFY